MKTYTIEQTKIFTLLNALFCRRDQVENLLLSFDKNDTLLNNVYNNELNEIDTLINELTK